MTQSQADGTRHTWPIWHLWRWPLHWQIMLGLVIGAVLGWYSGYVSVQLADELLGDSRAGVSVLRQGEAASEMSLWQQISTYYAFVIYELLGDMFMRGLQLIVVPIVMTAIILAISSLGQQTGFKRLGVKTLVYYLCTSMIAILIGLALINLFQPGFANGVGILEGQDMTAFADDQQAVEERVGGRSGVTFLDVFRSMVPRNIVDAAASADLLGLIIVSMLVGYFLSRLAEPQKNILHQAVQGVYDITLHITDLVLRLAPLGVLFLIARTVSEQYASLYPDDRFNEFIGGIVLFAAIVFAALVLHFLIVMPLILSLVARVNPIRHYKAMLPALTTAFSTASSAATLPLTMDCVEKRAGVSHRTTSFVLPLGATVNMDGTALYECAAAMFICQAFGIELTIGQQFFIVIVALLTSIGVAGVPSASLVAIAVILTSVQSQLEAQGVVVPLLLGMGLLFVFDRPLDMCRTAVNVFSDSVGAVTVARTEGEENVLQKEIEE